MTSPGVLPADGTTVLLYRAGRVIDWPWPRVRVVRGRFFHQARCAEVWPGRFNHDGVDFVRMWAIDELDMKMDGETYWSGVGRGEPDWMLRALDQDYSFDVGTAERVTRRSIEANITTLKSEQARLRQALTMPLVPILPKEG